MTGTCDFATSRAMPGAGPAKASARMYQPYRNTDSALASVVSGSNSVCGNLDAGAGARINGATTYLVLQKKGQHPTSILPK
jgi:hypothetical protein